MGGMGPGACAVEVEHEGRTRMLVLLAAMSFAELKKKVSRLERGEDFAALTLFPSGSSCNCCTPLIFLFVLYFT
jgi:hypothetical protein